MLKKQAPPGWGALLQNPTRLVLGCGKNKRKSIAHKQRAADPRSGVASYTLSLSFFFPLPDISSWQYEGIWVAMAAGWLFESTFSLEMWGHTMTGHIHTGQSQTCSSSNTQYIWSVRVHLAYVVHHWPLLSSEKTFQWAWEGKKTEDDRASKTDISCIICQA